MFDELWKKQEDRYEQKEKKPIKITLPDGAIKEGTSFVTTPLDIAKSISSGYYSNIINPSIKTSIFIVGKFSGTQRLRAQNCHFYFLRHLKLVMSNIVQSS